MVSLDVAVYDANGRVVNSGTGLATGTEANLALVLGVSLGAAALIIIIAIIVGVCVYLKKKRQENSEILPERSFVEG